MAQAVEAASSSLQFSPKVPGERRKMERAFSLCRMSPRDWSNWFTMMEFCSPEIIAFCLASSLHTL